MLRLDAGQSRVKALILGDRGMGHALLARVKNPIGQQDAFPADLEGSVCIGIGIYIVTDCAARMLAIIQNELPALGMNDQIGTDLPLIANAEDIGQP